MNFFRSDRRVVYALVAIGAILCAAQYANAQSTCTANSDCPKGYTCEVVGGTACTQPACAPGETCEPVPCRSEEVKGCVPGPCKSDADCDEGMACYTQTYQECSGGGSTGGCFRSVDGGEISCADAAVTEPECKDVTESTCIPKYMAPCAKDADCGAGFKCKEQQRCRCSGYGVGGSSGSSSGAAGAEAGGSAGSSASATLDAGAASGEVPVPVDAGPWDSGCGCTGTGEFYCEAEEINCEADGDCPTDWTCEETGTTGTAVCATSTDADASPICVDAGAAEPAPKQCMPPYSDLYSARGASYNETLGAPKSANGGTTGGVVGTAGTTGAAAGTGEAADASTAGESKASGKDDSGGCQVALGHAGSPSSVLLIAGLFAMLGLRRRRRG